MGYCRSGLRVVDDCFGHTGFNTLTDRVKGVFDHALRINELEGESQLTFAQAVTQTDPHLMF